MLKVGSMYAVNAGTYGGQYIVVCENQSDKLDFVTLPDKAVMSVTMKDFHEGVEKNIITHVADLPDGVYAYCKDIYENKNNNI